MGDQERTARTMLEEPIYITKGRGEWVGPVPENSPAVAPQSNGRAERSAQQLEGNARTCMGDPEVESKLP